MSDLSEEPLNEAEMTNWFEMIKSFSPDHLGRAHEMLYSAIAEIRRHRSALAADRERVRSVVRDTARHAIDSCYYDDRLQARTITVHGEKTTGCVAEVSERIATRAADQLAMAGVFPPANPTTLGDVWVGVTKPKLTCDPEICDPSCPMATAVVGELAEAQAEIKRLYTLAIEQGERAILAEKERDEWRRRAIDRGYGAGR